MAAEVLELPATQAPEPCSLLPFGGVEPQQQQDGDPPAQAQQQQQEQRALEHAIKDSQAALRASKAALRRVVDVLGPTSVGLAWEPHEPAAQGDDEPPRARRLPLEVTMESLRRDEVARLRQDVQARLGEAEQAGQRLRQALPAQLWQQVQQQQQQHEEDHEQAAVVVLLDDDDGGAPRSRAAACVSSAPPPAALLSPSQARAADLSSALAAAAFALKRVGAILDETLEVAGARNTIYVQRSLWSCLARPARAAAPLVVFWGLAPRDHWWRRDERAARTSLLVVPALRRAGQAAARQGGRGAAGPRRQVHM